MNQEWNCGQCRHWLKLIESDDKQYALGECRRLPPSISGAPARSAEEVHIGAWPATRSTGWCGEFQPTAPKKATERPSENEG